MSLCLTIFQRDFKLIPEVTYIFVIEYYIRLLNVSRQKMKTYLPYCYIKDSLN